MRRWLYNLPIPFTKTSLVVVGSYAVRPVREDLRPL
jgi:hypothetical protein